MEIDKTLKELVIEEAINLREYATPEELDSLVFNNVNGQDPNRCIYGQLTGDCFSDRAHELIIKCCNRVFTVDMEEDRPMSSAKINGKPYPIAGSERNLKYFSPIEIFIYDKKRLCKNVKPIVQFLKGEITEQEFKERI